MGEKDYNPQMHTLEHLLNGTIAEMFGCGRAFTTHIEKKKSKVDFHFNRNLTEEEIAEIERRVNGVISSDAEVMEYEIPINEARERFDLSRLPEGVEGNLRIINVGNYDHCPCIGNHVERTSEIGGLLKIISTDYSENILRVRFKIIQ